MSNNGAVQKPTAESIVANSGRGDGPGRRKTSRANPPALCRNDQAAWDFFRSFRQVDKEWLQNPAYGPTPWHIDDDLPAGADGFVSQTLNTPRAVPHLMFLVKNDLQLPPMRESLEYDGGIDKVSGRKRLGDHRPPDLVMLAQLQSPGLDGWPGIAHGGVTCLLLDHTMGHAVMAHRRKLAETGNALANAGFFTAGLTVRFVAPVKTAGELVVGKSWVEQRTAKKWLVKGQVTTLDGQVLVEGISLWAISRDLKL